MTNDAAKFILTAYRPDGRDAFDPQFGAALEQAKHDPALGAWFARMQAFDGAVAQKLTSVSVPAGLRDAILAGARVSVPEKEIRRVWSPRWLLAAAAAVVFGVGLGVWQSNRLSAQTVELADAALDDMRHGKHGGQGVTTAEFQRWLSDRDTHLASANAPLDTEALRKSGCRTLTLAGRPMLEVCFTRDGAEFHVYIMSREQLPGVAPRQAPVLLARSTGSAAIWADERHAFALVAPGNPAGLSRVL
jgi:hypothetical protein